MTVVYDSRSYPKSVVALDEWRDLVSSTFVPIDIEPLGDPFWATLVGTNRNLVELTHVAGGAQAFTRDATLSARHGEDVCKVIVLLKGVCFLEQEGRQERFEAGSMWYFDCARPYNLTFPEVFEFGLAMIPRSALYGDRTDGIFMPPVVFNQGTLRSRVLHSLMTQLATELKRAGTGIEMPNEIVDSVVSMTGAMLREAGGDESRLALRSGVVQLLRYVEEHLGDPDLNVESLARAMHVSVRQVQRLFAIEGVTVSSWLKRRRLDMARIDLASPNLAHVPVTTIGRRWGFGDAAHFSRVFKAAYGASPTNYRQLSVLGDEADSA